MILSKSQRIGAAILFIIALTLWFTAALWLTTPDDTPSSKKRYRSWEERKDSMKRADSLRYAQWAAEREQRYDSFQRADSIRRAEWRQIRQHQYDSFRREDSLWRDSLGMNYPRKVKKDTILDLNHCDTAQLQLIRGIGHYTAIQIVRYREQLGGYYSVQQLTDTPFAKCRLDTLLTHFTADSSDVQTIPVNTCSLDRLQRHPYLRYNQAKAIYSLRRRRTRLRSIDDLRPLPEITEQDLIRLKPYLRFE